MGAGELLSAVVDRPSSSRQSTEGAKTVRHWQKLQKFTEVDRKEVDRKGEQVSCLRDIVSPFWALPEQSERN